MIERQIKDLLKLQKKNILKCKILCIGDIILDHYIYGEVNRISPEAPIPILLFKKELYQLGGVGNVSKNLSSMGCKNSLLYLSSKDDSSNIINKLISKEKNIKKIEIKIPKFKIPVKTRYINKTSQIVRVDKEDIYFNVNNRYKKIILNKLELEIKKHDLIILSDYNKGLLDKSLIQDIVKIAKKFSKKIIADPKKTDLSAYKNIDLITPNQKEITDAAKKKYLSEKELISFGKKLINRYDISDILITRSEKGMLLISHDKVEKISANAKKVIDVTGAGDTVISTLSLMLAIGISKKDSVEISNYVAGLVIGKIGTASIDLKRFA